MQKNKLVVLSGAGMSVESGLKTFRDSEGLWEEHDVMDVCSIEGWVRNKELVLNFYNDRRKQLFAATPNEGHRILAELGKKYDMSIITQNVDNLHEQAGSDRVIHLHGELTKVRSCKNSKLIYSLDKNNCEIYVGDLADDGEQLRPDIVWFGEDVPMMNKAINLVEEADVFIIVGTSLNVYPAASLVNFVKEGASKYLIDPNEVYCTVDNLVVIKKGASEGLFDLAEMLK